MDFTADSPFQAAASGLWDAGLCPIPCGGEDGKRPLVSTKNWPERPSRAVVDGWVRDTRFEGANVGLLTGLSRLVVVDIDDPAALSELLGLFGQTPIMVSTPSGGTHLWYRARGERCMNLRPRGVAADIKGIGGFVVAPPSIRPADGRRYRFAAGGLAEIRRLPVIAPRATEWLTAKNATQICAPGQRNNHLFRQALRLARGCGDLDELTAELLALNRITCDPPLPAAEIARAAASAWRYQQSGRNFSATGGFACSKALQQRIGKPDALWLFAILMEAHASRMATGEPFAISVKAMAAAGIAAPLGVARLRKARDRLIAADVLRVGILAAAAPAMSACTGSANWPEPTRSALSPAA